MFSSADPRLLEEEVMLGDDRNKESGMLAAGIVRVLVLAEGPRCRAPAAEGVGGTLSSSELSLLLLLNVHGIMVNAGKNCSYLLFV